VMPKAGDNYSSSKIIGCAREVIRLLT